MNRRQRKKIAKQDRVLCLDFYEPVPGGRMLVTIACGRGGYSTLREEFIPDGERPPFVYAEDLWLYEAL